MIETMTALSVATCAAVVLCAIVSLSGFVMPTTRPEALSVPGLRATWGGRSPRVTRSLCELRAKSCGGGGRSRRSSGKETTVPRLDEWNPRRGRTGRGWRRLVKELCPPGSLCQVPGCRYPGQPIRFGLRRNHPLGPSLDHIVPLHRGGHPTAAWNLRPAHFGCNAGRPRERVVAHASRSRAALPASTAAASAGRRSRAALPLD